MSCCIRLCDQLGLGEWGELARCEHRMHGIAWDCEGAGGEGRSALMCVCTSMRGYCTVEVQ